MNLTLSSFLVEDGCRAVRVEYDPDLYKNNNTELHFKTLDPSIQKDDLVVVPTNTRHKFTVVKVIDIDFTINYDSTQEFRWIVGKVDKTAYDGLLEADKEVISTVGKIEENKKKRELMEAMGITKESVSGFTNVMIAAPAAPQRSAPVAPVPERHEPRSPVRPSPTKSFDDDIPF